MDTGRQQLRRVAVAKIVKADTRNALRPASKLNKLMSQASRRHRLAIVPRTDQRRARLSNAEAQQRLRLFVLQAAQFFGSIAGQGNRPTPFGFGSLES